MKTYQIELQRLKAAKQGNGLVEFAIDAHVAQQAAGGDAAATSVLSMTEANARVLMALLKTQLSDVDKRKARSQR